MKFCPCVINRRNSKHNFTTCVQKIWIYNNNGEKEIIVVSMKPFKSIRIEFVFEEKVFHSVAKLTLTFCLNLVLFEESG